MILQTANASTFHFDGTRSGNFTDPGPKTDDVLFEVELTGLVGASPVIFDDTVYISNWMGWGEWNPGFFSIDALTGEINWVNSNIHGVSTAAVTGDYIFVGSYDGYLNCLNRTTGEVIWRLKVENDPQWWGVASSPLVYNGTVYVVSFSDGTLHAVDLNGEEKWSFSTNATAHYTSPVGYDGRVLFVGNSTSGKTLYCLNEKGEVIWSVQIGEVKSSPVIHDNLVFLAASNMFYAIDLSDGGIVWSKKLEGAMSTPAVAFDRVYVGTADGEIVCMNASTGDVIWVYRSNGKIDSSPAYSDNVVYFATNTKNGTIYALNASNGELIWKYTLNPPAESYYNIMSSPFIYDGRLYIGADDGKLRCFGKQIIWDGEVELNPGIASLVIDGDKITLNNFTALSALLRAAEKGNFSVSILNTSWGLYVESIAGISPENNHYWLYTVNGVSPSVGAAGYTVEEDDVVEFYYAPWGVSAEKARYRMIMHVNLTNVLYKLKVNISPGTFNITAGENTYTVDNLTALSALYVASKSAGFQFLVDDSWYDGFGLLVNSIAGIQNDGFSGWMYQVNNELPSDAPDKHSIKNGDVIWWYYSTSLNDTPQTSQAVIQLIVNAPEVVIGSNKENAAEIGYKDQVFPLNVTDEAILNALRYLKSLQNDDGGFSNPGESSSISKTSWAIMAMVAAKQNPEWWVKNNISAIDYIEMNLKNETGKMGVADYARTILAVYAAGRDPSDFGGFDLVELLKSKVKENGQIGDFTYTTIWGLMALKVCGEDVSRTVDWLKSQQNPDGGFGWAPGEASDYDDTAAAIQALIATGEDSSSDVIAKALNYLRTGQNEDGGFKFFGNSSSNAASDSWIIQAIIACGQNPLEWKRNNISVVDHLLSLQQPDGSFYYTAHQKSNPGYMTSSAIIALLGKPFPLKPEKWIELNFSKETKVKESTMQYGVQPSDQSMNKSSNQSLKQPAPATTSNTPKTQGFQEKERNIPGFEALLWLVSISAVLLFGRRHKK
jgi:outer membrane protein assembly factor BamB/prenyltransferase beta subunit